ncbi:tereporin-Ca1-like [Mizuhopecten yessoensis]|uniref:Conoporin-Cn1 n=1 Tax=Mizuhopecten yessoensis TaxID=6573 RepID=A0A210PJV6_MIZYE|nr:tereporin-Ca1-like [Mizuhopecten yessoensis]OWF36767.1 Conoporin-Cn1 [Mizuhopecten yessoensis]
MIGQATHTLLALWQLGFVLGQLDPQIVSAITGGIIDGTSLHGTSLNSLMDTLSYRNVIGMEVDNYSKWAMTSPIAYPDRGVVTLSPREVHSGQREAMLARKTSLTATGTQGTVSWLIDNRRVIVMWEAPFNFDFYSNKLAVGIIPYGTHTSAMFDVMNKGSGNFTRGVYDRNIHTIVYCDEDLCVEGTMGTSHKTQVHIQVIPTAIDNVARTLETYIPETLVG